MKKIASSEKIEKFSQNNYIYVDKTRYIYNLITNYERIFFSRPRRFGKSLTLNTIGTLFERGVEPYFKGTWIYDKWAQDKYPVLHLSFLNYSVDNVAEFKRNLCNILRIFARKLELKNWQEDKEPHVLISNIFAVMPYEMQFVLLIDEYDCQLTANINNPELYEQFRTCLRNFYAVLKGVKQIKFLAVTGVTRLKDVSIFSVGSDIKDLSYDHAYSQMIGFTRDEIKKFYLEYLKLGVCYEKHKAIENITNITDAEIEEFLDRMADYYDGYCFDRKYRNKVFSTYSVNTFLQTLSSDEEVEFGNYWYEAGGLPSILRNYMQSHDLDIEKLLSSELTVPYDDFVNPGSLLNINEHVLMYQTGYLTLKSEIKTPRWIKLGTASREVSSALNSLLSQKFFNPAKLNFFYDVDPIFENGSAEDIINHLNSVLATIPYDQYPVESEAGLRALIFMYLSGLRYDVRAEQHNYNHNYKYNYKHNYKHNYKGRSDLLINFRNRRVVIELKYVGSKNEEKEKLSEALMQLNEQDYGFEDQGKRELLLIAAVFNGEKNERRFTTYTMV